MECEMKMNCITQSGVVKRKIEKKYLYIYHIYIYDVSWKLCEKKGEKPIKLI